MLENRLTSQCFSSQIIMLKGSCINLNSRKKISIIGSGPSGFYTAYRLLKKSPIPIDITIWEALPTPFGLSRYGVAADHPEVKNCEETFTSIANRFLNSDDSHSHRFQFFGNVTVGRDISLKSIMEAADATVLSYGCSGDKKLNIPGEDTSKGVFTSREFVGWYNGHPHHSMDARLQTLDWSRVRKIGIIGNGNVSLDISRLLLTAKIDEIWSNTDINQNALQLLKTAPIEEVKLIARRDFLHSKFTNKELREMWELERFGVRGRIADEYFTPSKWDLTNGQRSVLRCVQMCEQYLKPYNERKGKSFIKFQPPVGGYTKFWELDYLKTPLQINTHPSKHIRSIKLCRNSILADNKLIKHTEHVLDYDLDLLITSLGYCALPLPDYADLGIKFSGSRVANHEGQVLDTKGIPIVGLYATGWISKGSSGVIMSTMLDSFAVADKIINYLSTLSQAPTHRILPSLDNLKYTTWSQWLRINAAEKKRAIRSQPRQKILTLEEMLRF